MCISCQTFDDNFISIGGDPSTSDCACADLEQRLADIEQWRNSQIQQSPWQPRDCAEYLRLGFNTSGLYAVTHLTSFQSGSSLSMVVYCDMETDGGGWTVFQRRVSSSVSFEQNWHDYRTGFGSFDGSFWWGNDKIALALDDGRQYALRVDMTDWTNEHRYATYGDFRVASQHDNFRLRLGTYAGDAGDGLRAVDNTQFTTADRDNDGSSDNCATLHRGGFWFGDCHNAHPNGPYSDTSTVPSSSTGVVWIPWHGADYSLKRIDMKFRAISQTP